MMEKTCGNCSHCRPIEWSCDSEKSGFNYIVDADESWCHGKAWKPRTDTLYQRYQQLESMAVGMWHELKDIGCPGFRLGMLRGRLLQLGVFVDE